ncbi:hypothetical protein C9426_24050 [Serratia sp. S1B]|nr:hypothetical protein C9426_24050 [Serratia sp. S1B]
MIKITVDLSNTTEYEMECYLESEVLKVLLSPSKIPRPKNSEGSIDCTIKHIDPPKFGKTGKYRFKAPHLPIVNLTPEQDQFAKMLKDYPRLVGYWDFTKGVCDEVELRNALSVMSSGEQHLARFFLGVWTGQDEGFDMVAAASVLANLERRMLMDWLDDPFWP